MIWIPGTGENPFSFSERWGITVREVYEDDGKGRSFTSRMMGMKEGGHFFMRGPYGNGFPVDIRGSKDRQDVIIAGGCGSAPLRPLASMLWYVKSEQDGSGPLKILAGAKTAEELLFAEEFSSLGGCAVFTDDGSEGIRGPVTDGIKDIDVTGDTVFYACGPERMMKVAAEEAVRTGAKPENIYLSLERYMKCGMGLCGSCDCGGYLVCRDGPVFSYDKLRDNAHFGVKKRKKSGKLVYI